MYSLPSRISIVTWRREIWSSRASVTSHDDERPTTIARAPRAADLPYGTFDPSVPNTEFRMPITFGGDATAGTAGVAYYPDNENLYLVYETDAEALRAFIPSGLTLLNGQLVVSFSNAERVDWLAGRGYRMITVTANVGYSYANGTTFESTLTLAIWEDWSIA